MRVVFLDFDGVLNREGSASVPSEPRFERDLVERLWRILAAGNASIVVVSGWRSRFTLAGLRALLAQATIHAPVLDAVAWAPTRDGRDGRMAATLRWLRQHPEVTSWVVLDDSFLQWSFDGEWGRGVPAAVERHLVRPVCGLTEANVARAIAILGGPA
jgi:hypothetical protein